MLSTLNQSELKGQVPSELLEVIRKSSELPFRVLYMDCGLISDVSYDKSLETFSGDLFREIIEKDRSWYVLLYSKLAKVSSRITLKRQLALHDEEMDRSTQRDKVILGEKIIDIGLLKIDSERLLSKVCRLSFTTIGHSETINFLLLRSKCNKDEIMQAMNLNSFRINYLSGEIAPNILTFQSSEIVSSFVVCGGGFDFGRFIVIQYKGNPLPRGVS